MNWTPEEKRWLSRACRLFRDRPKSIHLYTTDGEITACRQGSPSTDLNEHLADGGTIMACEYLDYHESEFQGLRELTGGEG